MIDSDRGQLQTKTSDREEYTAKSRRRPAGLVRWTPELSELGSER